MTFDSLVLDTHALLWFITDDARIGAAADVALADPAVRLRIPAIALAEACFLVERGRTNVPSVPRLLRALRGDCRIKIVPMGTGVVRRTVSMPGVAEMHDRQIVATAVLLRDRGDKVAVVTRDREITASGLVPVLW